jgi:hypothetical protein
MPDLRLFPVLTLAVLTSAVLTSAVLTSAVLTLLLGGLYYGLLGDRLASARAAAEPVAVTGAAQSPAGPPGPRVMVVELLRGLVLASIIAGLADRAHVDTWNAGLALGAVLWVGFPLVLWVGAVVHEGTPIRLAAIHAGDWLVKLLVLGVLLSVWR